MGRGDTVAEGRKRGCRGERLRGRGKSRYRRHRHAQPADAAAGADGVERVAERRALAASRAFRAAMVNMDDIVGMGRRGFGVASAGGVQDRRRAEEDRRKQQDRAR